MIAKDPNQEKIPNGKQKKSNNNVSKTKDATKKRQTNKKSNDSYQKEAESPKKETMTIVYAQTKKSWKEMYGQNQCSQLEKGIAYALKTVSKEKPNNPIERFSQLLLEYERR